MKIDEILKIMTGEPLPLGADYYVIIIPKKIEKE